MKKQILVQIRGFDCLIDESIASHIHWLNENGFHTIECCSGNSKDHDYVSCYPGIQFFTEIMHPEKLSLIEKTAIETNLKFSYNSHKFGIVENSIECKKTLSLNWNQPNEIERFMDKLKLKKRW